MSLIKGQYKPKKTEPKIWFESIKSLAQVLSNENQLLLQLIIDREPDSIKELAELAGRKSNNVSQTLKTLKRYGSNALNPLALANKNPTFENRLHPIPMRGSELII